AGARQIIAVDLDDTKLEWAKGFGATDTVNASSGDPVEAIQALTDGLGVDVAIEAIGLPQTFVQAFNARDLAGRLVLVGVPSPEVTVELPMIDIFGRGGSTKSSWYGDCLPTRDFPLLIDMHLSGRIDLSKFVSETISLDDVEEAFHKMERGEVLRSVVVL
ncbi:MAG TPA: zinc-binding dehydrogenase, partial [Acidimicrobiales bacterium]|nr:zinc-binding dehydrogenase [Acidimicrobiales bacterium]